MKRSPSRSLGAAATRRVEALAPSIPVALAALLLLPRLRWPAFGMFDDAVTLRTARALVQGKWGMWDMAAGRFRPLYWAFWALLEALFGEGPLWWFLAQGALLLGSVLALVILARRLGAGPLAGALTGVLFTLAPATVESFYTLSKGEPLQVFFLLMALLVALPAAPALRGNASAWRVLGVASLVLLSIASKESGIAIVPLAVLFYLVAIATADEARRRNWRDLALGALLGGGLYLAARALAFGGSPLAGGGYASAYLGSGPAVWAQRAMTWAARVLHDMPYLLLAGPVLAVAVVRGRGQARLRGVRWLLMGTAWLALWVAVLLPVRFVVGYYLLPFALAASLAGGLALEVLYKAVVAPYARLSLGRRLALGGVALILGLMMTAGAVNALSDGRIQLAVDGVNQAFLTRLRKTAPQGGSLWLNIRSESEYAYEFRLHMQLLQARSDLSVQQLDADSLASVQDGLLILPYIENQPAMTVRLGFDEPSQRRWNDAARRALLDGREPLARELVELKLLRVELPFLACQWVPHRTTYCQQAQSFLDRRIFTYGWEVYALGDEATHDVGHNMAGAVP